MPRYVILKHETSQGAHFDFMLEMDGALKTWSLAQAPEDAVGLEAKPLADHRLAYLDFQGPLSQQRGFVTRWDQGTYDLEEQSEVEIIVRLKGEKLRGRASLKKFADSPECWNFSFSRISD